jgi:outer membrane lipoprotein-sorting protein
MLTTSLVLTLVAASPTAEELLAEADAILLPQKFESDFTMTISRASGEELTFAMHMFKQGDELCRIQVLAPSVERGTEMMRNGEAMWTYLPSIQRAVKASSTDAFHRGDFSNADLLPTKLAKDYTPRLVETTDDIYLLELKPNNDRAAYATIHYLLRKSDAMPLSQKFFTASGELIRTLDFYDPQRFGNHVYPTRMVMWSMRNPKQHSELRVSSLSVKADLSPGLFQVASPGL